MSQLGNLDSKSAEEIIKLLSEISKDKLVIIVTHNLEQVEKYATRLIKMHDGKILEDKTLSKPEKVAVKEIKQYKTITFLNKLRLGIRNTFNILPKFLLIFAVFFFITISLLSEYSSFKEAEYETDKLGYNRFFNTSSDKRIIIKKNDNKAFSNEDYEKISSLDNVDYIVENDVLLDTSIGLNDDSFYFYGYVNDIKQFEGELDIGRMPENDYEIVIEGYKDDYYLDMGEELIDKKLDVVDIYTTETNNNFKLKIVGIKLVDTYSYNDCDYNFYVSDIVLDELRANINESYSTIKTLFNNKYYSSNAYDSYFHIVPNDNVEKGKAYVSSDFNYLCDDENCKNKKMTIYIENMYYSDSLTVTISDTYTKYNFKKLTNLSDYDYYNGTVFVNTNDYNNLFSKETYQSSVFVKNINNIDETDEQLQSLGLETLQIRNVLSNEWSEGIYQAIKIFKLIVTIILVITLFFISYFIIKIILKSRNTYFTTIRILGSTKRVAKQLLDIELFIISNLAYFVNILLIVLVNKNIITAEYIKNLSEYIAISDYAIIYVILIVISQIVSARFIKKVFTESAIKTYKEEV